MKLQKVTVKQAYNGILKYSLMLPWTYISHIHKLATLQGSLESLLLKEIWGETNYILRINQGPTIEQCISSPELLYCVI